MVARTLPRAGRALDLPPSITKTLAPLQTMIEVLTEELARADETFATIAAQDPVVARLTTLPGIGSDHGDRVCRGVG